MALVVSYPRHVRTLIYRRISVGFSTSYYFSCYVVRNKISNHSHITLRQYTRTAANVYSLSTTRSSRIVSTELTPFLTWSGR